MKRVRRLVGVMSALSVLVPAAALAATGGPVRLIAAARGQLIEAPGADARAEIITFGEDLAPSLLRISPDDSVQIAGWPVAPEVRADVQVIRFDIYAPGAKIWRIEGDLQTEVPRSRLVFFKGEIVGDPEARVFISVDPETQTLSGFTMTPEGFQEVHPLTRLEPDLQETRRHVVGPSEALQPEGGEEAPWTCDQLVSPLHLFEQAREASSTLPLFAPAISSLHTATIAIDTDNEIMNNKFGGNTTTATNYIASLFASMNVTYERDLLIRLLQGTTFLRPGSGDPYSSTGDETAKVIEFTSYWSANNGSIIRALAAMLSGRGAVSNGASGSAWIDTLCDEGFGYSYSLPNATGTIPTALDIKTIGHEIGHNFGSPHTHCYTPLIDTCFSGDSLPGHTCHSGPTSCPAPATIGGVPNVRGTIMSYCHPPFLPGCTSSPVFHPATVSLLQPLIEEEVDNCIFPAITPPTISQVSPNHGLASGGTSVTITGTGFQSGATVSFGGTASPSVTFNGSTQLTATTPAHAAGLVGVTVTNPDTGSATANNSFTFDPLPTISGLSPNNGTTAGGTPVIINGANFQNGATATFGGSPVAVTFLSSTQLSFTTPAHATGTVGIVVTNPDTGFGTLANAFFYAPPPSETDFFTLSPCRVLDTRNPNGPQGGPQLGPLGERSFPVAGLCGVPANAVAVAGNLAVITPSAPGNLSIYPGNAFFLGTSVLNFRAGVNLANNAIILLATDGAGTVKIRNGSSGNAHVLFDVVGYFIE